MIQVFLNSVVLVHPWRNGDEGFRGNRTNLIFQIQWQKVLLQIFFLQFLIFLMHDLEQTRPHVDCQTTTKQYVLTCLLSLRYSIAMFMNILCLMFALWLEEAGYDTRFKMVFFHLKIQWAYVPCSLIGTPPPSPPHQIINPTHEKMRVWSVDLH